MRRDIINLLRCPACGQSKLESEVFTAGPDSEVLEGYIWCSKCSSWYPIEDGLLELLVGNLVYHHDRTRFWSKYAHRLSVHGLKPDAATIEPNQQQLQTQQQEHFDWYAANGQQTYSAYEQRPFWLATDRIAFAPWRREIQPQQWLLDVGCAQGRSTFKVTDLDINVIGFDVSKHLVRQAIQRYRQQPCRAKATFFASDASSFPLISESVDYVLVYGVLHHVPNVDQTCLEIARVLKPSGIYWGSENNATIFRGLFDFLQRINPLWHEQAGPEALISSQRLSEAFAATNVRIRTSTSVFLPPHLINLVSPEVGYRLLRLTDGICRAIPILQDNGGLILIRGIKQ